MKKEKSQLNSPKNLKTALPVYRIDATGKSVGRLATEIAIILRGKNKASYQPHLDKGNEVVVKNISKLKFTGHKFDQKVYYHYSGYPSGLKEKKLSNIFPKNPGDILKRAVWNMLPKNKLREKMFKRLKITK